MQSGGLLLIASGLFAGCGGGSGNQSEPYDIPLVGNLPLERDKSTSVPSGGGQVELPGVALVDVPAGTFSSDTIVRMQATQDPNLRLLFQITASAALPTHRSAYEVRIGLGSELPQDKTVKVTLAIPDALLAAGSGAVFTFLRYFDPNPDDPIESFDPVDATVDLTAKTVTV